MNNSLPELQRIFSDLKAKNPDSKEKAAEELKKLFKNNLDFSEEVFLLNSLFSHLISGFYADFLQIAEIYQ